MASWQKLLEQPDPHLHFVQLYSDDAALEANVGSYIAEGLKKGENVLVFAMDSHLEGFRRNVASHGIDVTASEFAQTLMLIDAEQSLNRFMIDGVPDWNRFRKTVSQVVRRMPGSGIRPLRAYGEIVGVLWNRGEYSAAIRLEEFWNRLLAVLRAPVYCAYPIDILSPEFQTSGVHSILSDHTHLLSTSEYGELEAVIDRAAREVLGGLADELWSKLNAQDRTGWGMVPSAESKILWLREQLPVSAHQVISRVLDRYTRALSMRAA